LQNQAAKSNDVNSLGPLLYARLQRQDANRRRVVHIYLAKWLSIGSSPQAGLCVDAEDVAPHHAELLFKDGMYWIQNRVDQGGVWVCNHSLASNEAVPLEEGDTISIGSVARFIFERY
ncbi:MAG TPA: FHA domain-containing protein, partial [Candidatus Competibacteraceae bacterium]|nr:FHA domain-containing protein [Candidatus Competibacteraceae bacterium]